MAAFDEAGLKLKGSALFEKMRARTEAASETYEAEWTEREAQKAAAEREERVARLMEECGWTEEWDKASESVYYHCALTGETRWEIPSEAQLERQRGKASDPSSEPLAGYYWQSESGEVQGPRSAEEMREWYSWGYFAPGTLVREVSENNFVDIMTRPEIVEGGARSLQPSELETEQARDVAREPEPGPEPAVQKNPQPEPEPELEPELELEPQPQPQPESAGPEDESTASAAALQLPAESPQVADGDSSKPSTTGWLPLLFCLIAATGGALAMMISAQPLTTSQLFERHQGAVA